MRKGGPLGMRELAFKATAKGKEKETSGYISEEQEEGNFVKTLQVGAGRFRGKLPFKCFVCVRVGHYGTKVLYKENQEKGKQAPKINNKRFERKKLYK